MKKQGVSYYLAPEIEMNEVFVEQGFTTSDGSTTPEYEEDDDIIEIG